MALTACLSNLLRLFILLGMIALSPSTVTANEVDPEANELRVVALFKNAAMVQYNGKQKLYRAGQSLSPTIKLISADTRAAVFMIDGQKQTLELNTSGGYSGGNQPNRQVDAPSAKIAQIVRSNNGMYMTPGFINGVAVNFLVDTGASQVAMNERVAKQVGLLYKLQGERVGVNTAAGAVSAWRANLNKVRVGGIELTNVDALVIKGTGPGEVLLGMSFLNRVKLEDNGQLLKLIKKY